MAEGKINPPARRRAVRSTKRNGAGNKCIYTRNSRGPESASAASPVPCAALCEPLFSPPGDTPIPALDDGYEQALEAEAYRRAHDGVEEPIVYQGRFVYLTGPDGETVFDADGKPRLAKLRKYSDTLLMFLMKAAMPEKYRERSPAAQESRMHFTVDTGIEGAPGSAIE